MTRSMSRRCSPLFLLAACCPGLLTAQGPAYTAALLDGAQFRQTIRSQIRIETGSRVNQERSGREGRIMIRALAGDSGIELESWFDSLSVWRDAGEEHYSPDTDGLIGGRYRGRLSAHGTYQWLDQPFIPDPVAEIAELGTVLDDLLPPLPAGELAAGQAVALEGGWRIERRADSVAGALTLRRYTLTGERRHAAVGAPIDSLPVEANTYERETGSLVWDFRRGPLVWQRQITMTAALPAKGAIRRAVRTQIEQSVVLERLPDPTARPGPSAP
jgi:hypothetical protein